MKLMSPGSLWRWILQKAVHSIHITLNWPPEVTTERAKKLSKAENFAAAPSLILYLHYPRTEVYSLSYQKKRMKEAMFTITGLAVETEIGKTHKLKAAPLHHALLQWELSCLQDLFLPLPPSLEPWAGRKELTGVVPRERCDAQPLSHGRRLLLGRGTALFSQLFVWCGEHQLSNEDSLQAAVIKAFSYMWVF